MKNKDKYNTLQEAQYDYYKYIDYCHKVNKGGITFEGWLFRDENETEIPIQNVNRCVVCGEIIPEGRQVCLYCENKG